MVAEVSKPAQQVSQYTFPSTRNGNFNGTYGSINERLATASAGSKQSAISSTDFAIDDFLTETRERERETENVREKVERER